MSSETIRQTIDESEIVEHDTINGIYKLTDGREVEIKKVEIFGENIDSTICYGFGYGDYLERIKEMKEPAKSPWMHHIILVGDSGEPTKPIVMPKKPQIDFNPPA